MAECALDMRHGGDASSMFLAGGAGGADAAERVEADEGPSISMPAEELSSAATQKPPNERETPWLSLARATLA